MRIVLVNWAKIWDGAGYGGGVNGYCQALALELHKRGHDVVSLCGGRTYVPSPTPDITSPCQVRRHPDWLGVKVFEVINSPVLSPSICQFQDPMGEVSSPELEAEVGRLFELLRPDAVHFNNLEGFSVGCVERARAAGARVIFTLHNYHTICPQVYLMQGHRHVCHDYDNGHNCAGCIQTTTPAEERRKLAEAWLKDQVTRQAPEEEQAARITALRRQIEQEWGGFKHEFTWPVRIVKKGLRVIELRGALRKEKVRAARVEPTRTSPGEKVEGKEDVESARPFTSADIPPGAAEKSATGEESAEAVAKEPELLDQRGQTQQILHEVQWRPWSLDPDDWPALENEARPDPPSSRSPNDYARRRAAMIAMLNSCDRVLAVSDFVRRKFVALGVEPGVIETLHIGSRAAAVVERAADLVFDPPPFERRPDSDQRPMRLVFMGYNNHYKGLHVLAEGLGMMTPEYLRRIDLSVFALDGQSVEWVFRRMEPRLAKLTFVPGYTYNDIPWMLGGKDLGVVPSVWWDNGPQTVMEFFACRVPVLGAAVGGIPDFVKDGVNGLLFRGNDPWGLARRLAEVAREPWRLTEMRGNVRPPKDMGVHARELEAIYRREAAVPAVRRPERPR